MKSKPLLFLLLACRLFAEVPERILVVPREQLSPLLGGEARRVLIPLDEFRALQARAAAETPAEAPLQAVISDLEMHLVLHADHVRVNATLRLEGVVDGNHALPVGGQGIYWTRAALDEGPAALGGAPGGALTLFFSGAGPRELKLHGQIPLQTREHLQHLSFHMPQAPARLFLRAPGDVEIESGAVVMERRHDPVQDETRFRLHPGDGSIQAAFRVNRLRRGAAPEIHALVHHAVGVAERDETHDIELRLNILHQEIREVALRLPADFTVIAVDGAAVASWRVDEFNLLRVEWLREQIGPLGFTLRGRRPMAGLTEWTPPLIRVEDAATQQVLLGLSPLDGLKLREITPGDWIPVLASDALRPPAGFQLWFGDVEARPPRISFHIPEARVSAVANLLLTLRPEQVELLGSFVLVPRETHVHAAAILIPSDWEILTVTLATGQSTPFEVFPAGEDQKRIQVRLPDSGDIPAPVEFRLHARQVPAGWLESGGEMAIIFPSVRLPGMDEISGALAVEAQGELLLGSVEARGLTPMDENEKAAAGLRASERAQAWRFEGDDHGLRVETHRPAPEIQVETYSFVRVEPGRVRMSSELIHSFRRTRPRELSFFLPMVLPPTQTLTAERGTTLEHVSREAVEGGEMWTYHPTPNPQGVVHVSLDFDLPLVLGEAFHPPVPSVPDLEIQSGHIVFEGSAELDITLDVPAREVDPGETAVAAAQTGPRVLGAFAFVGTPPRSALTATRHPLAPVAEAQVLKLNLISRLEADGGFLHQAGFTLVSPPAFLEVLLPSGGSLWGARVDGQPIEPRQAREGSLLLPLPDGAGRDRCTVELLYQTRVDALGLRSRVRSPAPALRDPSTQLSLPTVEMFWRLLPPQGFEMRSSRGAASPVHPEITPLAAVKAVGGLWDMAGGLGSARTRGVLTSSKEQHFIAEMDGGDVLFLPEMIPEMELGFDESRRAPPPSATPVESAPPPPPRVQAVRADSKLAATGFRSLTLVLDTLGTGPGLHFHHLGGEGGLDLVFVESRRHDSLAWFATLLVLFGAVFYCGSRAPKRFRYLVGVLLFSTLLAAMPGLFAWIHVWNQAFYTALILIPLHGLLLLLNRMSRPIRALLPASLCGLLLLSPADLRGDTAPDPRPIPADALLQVADSQDLWVPLQQMEDLWTRLRELEAAPAALPPALHWTDAESRLVLANEDTIALSVVLRFQTRGEETVSLVLPIGDAVLRHAALATHPLRHRRVEKGLELFLPGGVSDELRLEFQVPTRPRGSGRSAQILLPPLPAHRVRVTAPDEATELTLRQGDMPRILRMKANEVLELHPAADGSLTLDWGPLQDLTHRGGSLQVRSRVVWDLRDDSPVLLWHLEAELRGEPLTHLDLRLPEGWRLASAEDGNLRGWEPLEDGLARLHFLRPVERSLSVLLRFHARPAGSASDSVWRETLPELGVPGAERHSGEILLRKPRRLRARVLETEGLQREALNPNAFQALIRAMPQGVGAAEAFQLHRFSAPGYAMTVEVERVEAEMEAAWQSIFRIADRERVLEARCVIRIQGEPLHQLRFRLAAGMRVDSVRAPGVFLWHEESGGDGTDLLLFSGGGWRDSADILITARESVARNESIALPELRLLGAAVQRGQWVIQADPIHEVQARGLREMELISLAATHAWLNPAQRPFSRLALGFDRERHGAELLLTRRPSEIHSTTFTNLRVTDRVVEETVLLEFQITGSGTRSFVVHLPAHLADARLRVPLLRRMETRPLPDQPGWVEMSFELQDEVMGELILLLEQDRPLVEGELRVWTPRVLTGREGRAFVTLENAGRDEVMIEDATGLEPLTRQHAEWVRAVRRLRGNTSHAYVSRESAPGGELTLRTSARERVRTAGASIGLASVRLVMDASGSYRAHWRGQVDNRTEPFLLVDLPEGATLLAVTVAGEATRPARGPGDSPRRIRIPLVKNAAGELDVPVEFVYGGRIPGFDSLRNEGFPLPTPVNLAVERSQVELQLPRDRRWLRFDGSMRGVDNEQAFAAGSLQYQADLVQRLSQSLQAGGEYERARARQNVLGLSSAIQKSSSQNVADEDVQAAWISADRAVREAEGKLQESVQLARESTDLNRIVFNDAFESQGNVWGNNQVLRNQSNWVAQQAGVGSSTEQTAQRQDGRRATQMQMDMDYSQLRGVNVFQGQTETPAQESMPRDGQALSRGLRDSARQYEERLEARQRPAADQTSLANWMPAGDPDTDSVYRFTTPRGETRITAWSLSSRAWQGLGRLGAFVGAFLLAIPVFRPRKQKARTRRPPVALLVFPGLVLLLSGVLPLLGIALLVSALFLALKRRKERKAD